MLINYFLLFCCQAVVVIVENPLLLSLEALLEVEVHKVILFLHFKRMYHF